MASADNKDDGGCGFCAWTVATVLYVGFFVGLASLPSMDSLVYPDEQPTTCSVELISFDGLQPAMAPGATSPAFDLLIHINNGHTFALTHGGGDVVVSYARVPLARGRTPSFRMATKETAALPVKATSTGVGVPEDLFRLMTEERRWGVAQLRIELGLAWDSFVCNVDLDGQRPRVSECYKPTAVN